MNCVYRSLQIHLSVPLWHGLQLRFPLHSLKYAKTLNIGLYRSFDLFCDYWIFHSHVKQRNLKRVLGALPFGNSANGNHFLEIVKNHDRATASYDIWLDTLTGTEIRTGQPQRIFSCGDQEGDKAHLSTCVYESIDLDWPFAVLEIEALTRLHCHCACPRAGTGESSSESSYRDGHITIKTSGAGYVNCSPHSQVAALISQRLSIERKELVKNIDLWERTLQTLQAQNMQSSIVDIKAKG